MPYILIIETNLQTLVSTPLCKNKKVRINGSYLSGLSSCESSSPMFPSIIMSLSKASAAGDLAMLLIETRGVLGKAFQHQAFSDCHVKSRCKIDSTGGKMLTAIESLKGVMGSDNNRHAFSEPTVWTQEHRRLSRFTSRYPYQSKQDLFNPPVDY